MDTGRRLSGFCILLVVAVSLATGGCENRSLGRQIELAHWFESLYEAHCEKYVEC